ncbi:MAG: helix-turn-helix transcriptional regulator [Chthoniobacteraceae bacterium]
MSTKLLSADQLRAFSNTLFHLYEDTLPAAPLEPIMHAMGELIPSAWLSTDSFKLQTGEHHHLADRNFKFSHNCKKYAEMYGHQNPVLERPRQMGFIPALKISDHTTFRQFSQTGYYAEIVGKLEKFRDQAGVYARTPESLVLFTVQRESNYTEEERVLLEIIQPHVERILQRSSLYASLPGEVLTAREREVLHWVAEGKRDEEIAIILRTSMRTVKQHVRAILRKLEVETRTAAAAMAWRARMAEKGLPEATEVKPMRKAG